MTAYNFATAQSRGWNDNPVQVLVGDCRALLPELADESVQCCVTSPPYWGLRDYGEERQLGLEKTPEEYVAKMVEVFREVRRVLRKDGTLWLNLGDSYSGSGEGGGGNRKGNEHGQHDAMQGKRGESGLKPKDLCGIPWRVAFALQADGWWLRSDIIWSKPNPMPESVTDRPTKAHEYLFLLSKSAKYYYDSESIKEPSTEFNWESRLERESIKSSPTEQINGIRKTDKQRGHGRRHAGFNDRWDAMEKSEQAVLGAMRNKRSVWTVATAPYPEAHFATYPPDLIKPCIMAGSRVGDTVL